MSVYNAQHGKYPQHMSRKHYKDNSKNNLQKLQVTVEERNNVGFSGSGTYLVWCLWSFSLKLDMSITWSLMGDIWTRLTSFEVRWCHLCHLQLNLQIFVWLEKACGNAQKPSPRTNSSNFYSCQSICLSSLLKGLQDCYWI